MKPNLEQVQLFLGEHFNHQATKIAFLADGGWSRAFSFTRGNKDYVIRFGAYVDDFLKDKLAATYNSPYLPTPQVYEVGEVFGGQFIISDRAYGKMLDQLNTEKMQRIVPAVFRALDAMRKIDLSQTRGFGGWDGQGQAPLATWKDYLLEVANDLPSRRTHGWRAALAASPVGDTSFNQAFKRLESLVDACPNDRNLIHTDLLNKNVLVGNDVINAVIDWGNAMYGDFLHDIACFAFWSPWFASMKDIDWEAEARKHFKEIGLAVPNMEERLLCYKIHIGLDAQTYNAYMKRWDELEINAKRTLELAKSHGLA